MSRLRRIGLRRLLLALLGLAVIALAVRLLLNSTDELAAAADNLDRVGPGWLALAILAEVASYVAYGAANRVLLRRGGARIGLAPVTALGVAGQAAAFAIPGGLAVTAAVTYRVLRRYRVEQALAASVLVLISLLYMLALAVLAIVGAPLAGARGPVPDLRGITYGVLGFSVIVIGALTLLGRRGSLGRGLESLARWIDRLGARLGARPPAGSRAGGGWAERMAAVSFGPAPLIRCTALLVACWLADALCLALCFYAVGIAPPWRGLLLAYTAAQLAATLPITPGGLGILEGSLTLALVAFGGSQSTTLAAVLLYRLISFWGLLPTGGLCYLAVRNGSTRVALAKQAA